MDLILNVPLYDNDILSIFHSTLFALNLLTIFKESSRQYKKKTFIGRMFVEREVSHEENEVEQNKLRCIWWIRQSAEKMYLPALFIN